MFKLFQRKEQTPQIDEELLLNIAAEIVAYGYARLRNSECPEHLQHKMMDVLFEYLRGVSMQVLPSEVFTRAHQITHYARIIEKQLSATHLEKQCVYRIHQLTQHLTDAEYALYNLDLIPNDHRD